MEEIDGCTLSTERFFCMLMEASTVAFHIDLCRDRLSFTMGGQCGGTKVYFNNPIGPTCTNKVHEFLQLVHSTGKYAATNITSAPIDDMDRVVGISQAVAHHLEEAVCSWAREDLYPLAQRLIAQTLKQREKEC
jgi:hypothetical protein